MFFVFWLSVFCANVHFHLDLNENHPYFDLTVDVIIKSKRGYGFLLTGPPYAALRRIRFHFTTWFESNNNKMMRSWASAN